MSIWCSGESIGAEYPDSPRRTEHHGDGSVRVRSDTGDQRGVVVSYASGWSNHYPEPNNPEAPASVDLATIPVWCVPGHREDEDWETVGPWVRLTVDGWSRDFHSGAWGPMFCESVVLDEEAARLLRDELDAWIARPKAQPITEAAE